MSEQSVPEKVNGVVYACIKTLYTLSEGKEIQFTVIPSLTIHPKIQQKPQNISWSYRNIFWSDSVYKISKSISKLKIGLGYKILTSAEFSI